MSLLVNVFCKDKGWLFEDIKRALVDNGCIPSEYPISTAEAWICIRSSELHKSPDIRRTIVQVHNMEPHDIDLFNSCAGVIFNHPMQKWLWQREGFNNRFIVRPIGARKDVQVSSELPDIPTIGFFCGENRQMWKGSNVFAESVLRARQVVNFNCLMIGRGLQHLKHLGSVEKKAAGVDDYSRVDAVFCASISPGIPLSVYEALASGLKVITTPRWFIHPTPVNVLIGDDVEALVKHICAVIENRRESLNGRLNCVYRPYLFEEWIIENIKLSNEWIQLK